MTEIGGFDIPNGEELFQKLYNPNYEQVKDHFIDKTPQVNTSTMNNTYKNNKFYCKKVRTVDEVIQSINRRKSKLEQFLIEKLKQEADLSEDY